eukprot:gene5403-10249_t
MIIPMSIVAISRLYSVPPSCGSGGNCVAAVGTGVVAAILRWVDSVLNDGDVVGVGVGVGVRQQGVAGVVVGGGGGGGGCGGGGGGVTEGCVVGVVSASTSNSTSALPASSSESLLPSPPKNPARYSIAQRCVAVLDIQNTGSGGIEWGDCEIPPDQAKARWAGTKHLKEAIDSPKPSGAEVFGTTQSASGGPWVSSYQLGCAQGLKPRPHRSWNQHILNYEDQFNRGPSVDAKIAVPTLGNKYNPYLSTRTPTQK